MAVIVIIMMGQLSWLSLWWLSWAESPSPSPSSLSSSSSLQISSRKRYHKCLGKWMTEPLASSLKFFMGFTEAEPHYSLLAAEKCQRSEKRSTKGGPKKFDNRCGSASGSVVPYWELLGWSAICCYLRLSTWCPFQWPLLCRGWHPLECWDCANSQLWWVWWWQVLDENWRLIRTF